MSVIGKKPFVNKIVDTCSKEQTQQIIDLMNHLGNPTLVALYGCDNLIGPANIGVSYVTLKMNQLLAQIVNGILVYIDDTHCGFFGITSNSDNIDEFEIDPVNKTYNKIRENLTVEELRQVCGDRLVEVGGNITVQADDIDSGSATEGQTLVADGQGGAVWGEAGGGLPEATKSGQVLVSNEDLQFEERDAVPMAENLTSAPETNDTMYSAGPTGGLADIATGEEAYLQEVKGYSIVWNQLLDANHGHTCVSGHYYIYYDGSSFSLIGPSSTTNYPANSTNKLFDLTLMFGGNDKIPFSLAREIEYPANGDMPIQNYYAQYGFQRFFANVDLYNTSYDAGTIKNVKTSKLTETGQNLYDSATMNGISPLLLAGYRYEIYFINGTSSTQLSVSKDGVKFRTAVYMSRYKLGNGKYIYTYTPEYNCYVKCGLGNTSNPIVYVGFVHSGNYCLTTGDNSNLNSAYTNATIPAYQKHEFAVSGIDGLNGIPDSSENHCSVYDTVDTTSVKSIDLSTLIWTAGEGAFSAEISDIKANTTNLLATQYLGSEMSVSGTTITITTTVSPTGTLLYELAEPVGTGVEPFKPIPLKDNQGNWIVNDMGFEYFAGLDICPVNQVSYYYENLKDKLVNLKASEIKTVPFKNDNASLEGIDINGTRYKILPTMSGSTLGKNAIAIGYHLSNGYGYANTDYSIAIGYGASSNGNSSIVIGKNAVCRNSGYAIAIGRSSEAYGTGAVAIGDSSNCGTSTSTFISAIYAVAIGSNSQNAIPYTVTFDGTTTDYQRTLVMFNPEKIFFRRELNSFTTTKNTLDKYAKGQHLSDFITNKTLTLQDGKYYVSYTDASNYKTFASNVISGTATDITSTITGVHITLKLSTDVVVGIDLLPYDTANSKHFTGYGIASDTPTFVSAYIDSDGTVVINPPSGVTVVEATYNIR